MEINPNWFEDIITFFAIYIVVCSAVIFYVGWRVWKWINKNDHDGS